MVNRFTDLQKSLLFIVLALSFSVFFSLLLPEGTNVGILAFIPLLAVLITMFFTREIYFKTAWARLNFQHFPVKLILVGMTVPIIPTLLGYIMIWNTDFATFMVPEEAEVGLLLIIASAIFSYIFVALTTILGEEIGWRGYLLPKLYTLGLQRAFFLSGFIWGIFHLPVMFLTDGYHAEMNLFLYIPLFLVNVTLAGFFIGYLCYKGNSIWPAITAHTSHNMIWAFGDSFTGEASPAAQYLTGDAGLFGIVFFLAVYLLIRKQIRHKKLEYSPLNLQAK